MAMHARQLSNRSLVLVALVAFVKLALSVVLALDTLVLELRVAQVLAGGTVCHYPGRFPLSHFDECTASTKDA